MAMDHVMRRAPDNVTLLLDSLLNGYDRRFRPDFGGEFRWLADVKSHNRTVYFRDSIRKQTVQTICQMYGLQNVTVGVEMGKDLYASLITRVGSCTKAIETNQRKTFAKDSGFFIVM